jgi:hypothetical protein
MDFEKDKPESLEAASQERKKQQEAQSTGAPTTPDPNSEKPESVPHATQPTIKPNGSAGSTEAQNNIGGGIFDPARWKTPIDARLDPKAPIKPAAFSKVEVKKPPQDHYVHAHPDPAFNGVFPLYSDSEAKRYDPYLIAPELLDSLPPQAKVNVKDVRLAVALTDSGRLFLWFIAQTGSEWHESGDSAILTAMTQWVKVISDGSGYRVKDPEVQLSEPVFPNAPFAEYLMRAFKDRYIDNLEHPVIRRLAGIR